MRNICRFYNDIELTYQYSNIIPGGAYALHMANSLEHRQRTRLSQPLNPGCGTKIRELGGYEANDESGRFSGSRTR